MRIVIDLQAAQTHSSRNRGIGRYSLSLALAMARNRGSHEILIALNGLFPESVETIRNKFLDILPRENIRLWHAPGPLAELEPTNIWRRESALLLREAFLGSLNPDIVHVSSLFEGFEESAVTSVGVLPQKFPTAVTLYDLIPYVYQNVYLENQSVRKWYLGKIEHLRRADLWLSISESSRREGIELLGLSEAGSVNISADADSMFQKQILNICQEKAIRQKYQLKRPFLLYTGGIDHRKNIEGLIRAFAILPKKYRESHQLAIVCSVSPVSRKQLEGVVAQHGLLLDDVIITGYIPDPDLVSLYNLCKIFVFPSWHEGFGLPVLEAMRCGAPVIGANASSIPEVIGWQNALFDPCSDISIAEKIEQVLSNEKFRSELVWRSALQALNFSWEESAKKAMQAMEQLHAQRRALRVPLTVRAKRLKLAYISPLPPVRSGIADYSVELLPELEKFYDITVIVDQQTVSDLWVVGHCQIRSSQWFVENAVLFDRVVYHFGNSVFHQHMFALLDAFPGVVVLHDFFHSGIVAHINDTVAGCGIFPNTLYHSHGYNALLHFFVAQTKEELIYRYPCNLAVIQQSLGIIVHSRNSLSLASRWYGGDLSDWKVISHLRRVQVTQDTLPARTALQFGPEDFVVCSFGMLAPTKLNHRLLKAWVQSNLGRNKRCYLIFVGENHQGAYGQAMLGEIKRYHLTDNVRITGWVNHDIFQQYLAAADLGVQLRALSRGETSGTVLDCMSHGLATIVNANGSMADLDDQRVWKLPDEFTDAQLKQALETLWKDGEFRRDLGLRAQQFIRTHHLPETCAASYYHAIEEFYLSAPLGARGIAQAVSNIEIKMYSDNDLMALSKDIVRSIAPRNRQRQLFVDVGEFLCRRIQNDYTEKHLKILRGWLESPPYGFRVEPVFCGVEGDYRYARSFTKQLLNIHFDDLQDDIIEYFPGDCFLVLNIEVKYIVENQLFYRCLRRQGVLIFFILSNSTFINVDKIDMPCIGENGKDYSCFFRKLCDGILFLSLKRNSFHIFFTNTKNTTDELATIIRFLFPECIDGNALPLCEDIFDDLFVYRFFLYYSQISDTA